jgi:hypothetical protein
MSGSDIKIPPELVARLIITLDHTLQVTQRASMTLGHVKCNPSLLQNLMASITESHADLRALETCIYDGRAAIKDLYIKQELEVEDGKN